MKTRALALGVLLSVGLLARGCGIAINAVRSNGSPGALNTWDGGGWTGAPGIHQVISATCISTDCVSVAKVDHPTALEAWAFTYKEAQYAPYGIPAGEVPITLYIVGPNASCDGVEQRYAAMRGRGAGMKAITEPCHGPFYFEKDR